MKKILFVLGAVGLLAAGCSGSQTTSLNEQNGTGDQESSVQTTSQTQASVQIKGADDAVNLVEQASANEQSQVSAGNDSDLTSSDSADLTSLTEVQNEY